MRRTRLSIAIGRSLPTEYPDHSLGWDRLPTYRNDCEMPAIAIVAIVAGGMSLAGVAAAGFAALTVASAFTAVAAIGAITSGIGMLTGNEKLTKIGAVMGLVGGVGGLAASAGMFGVAASTPIGDVFGAQAAVGPTAEGGGLINSAATAPVTPPVEVTGTPIPVDTNFDSLTQPGAAPQVTGSTGLATSPQAPPITQTAEVGQAPAGQAPAAPAAPVPTATPTPTPTEPPMGGMGDVESTSFAGGAQAPQSPIKPFSIVDTMGGWVKDFSTFAKDNPMVAYGMMQTGGALVGGLFDKNKAAEGDLARARAKQIEQETANMAKPAPVAVTGKPPPNPFAIKPYVTANGLIGSK